MNKKIREVQEPTWRKPDPKFVKVNVDASFHLEEGTGATSAIIRDCKGNFVAA